MSLHHCSNRDNQTRGYQWASYRSAFSLRDALIHIILGGDKNAFEEIVDVTRSCNIDRLSLTVSSYHSCEMQGVYFSYSTPLCVYA